MAPSAGAFFGGTIFWRLNLRLNVQWVKRWHINNRHTNLQASLVVLVVLLTGGKDWNHVDLWHQSQESSMKSERFTAGQLWIERNRRREGPPVVYTVMSGKTARPFTDPKAILKWVKWPKGTPTGDALREWLASFEQKPQAPAPELDMAKIKAEGFGPEAHDDDPSQH